MIYYILRGESSVHKFYYGLFLSKQIHNGQMNKETYEGEQGRSEREGWFRNSMLRSIRVELKAIPVFGTAQCMGSFLNIGRTKLELPVSIVQCSIIRAIEFDAEDPIGRASLANITQTGFAIGGFIVETLVVTTANSQTHHTSNRDWGRAGLPYAELFARCIVANTDGRWTACLGDGKLRQCDKTNSDLEALLHTP